MRALDRAHAFLFLQVLNASAEFFHFSPMHFGTEMVLCVVTVVEEQPVINSSVAADSPRNRLVGVRTVVPVIAIQVTKTMAEIPEGQELQHESPVNKMNRIRRDNYRHNQERRSKRSQFEIAPKMIAVVAFSQFLSDRAHIIAEET